jgi:hypothetical protein
MRTNALAPALLALALLCACEDERSSGVILTSDGRVMSNSAENNRQNAAKRIDGSLNERLGAHWRAKTTIAQPPLWDEGHDSEPEWRWDQCDVAIEIAGDGQATLPVAPAEIRNGVFDYLRPKVNRASRNLKVSVAVENDRARFMALAYPNQAPGTPITYATAAPPTALPAAPEPAPGPAAPPPSYIIQAGDTWAALATAFYGSPSPWRALADANHWNGGNPRVGEALLVPPAPAASPPPPATPAPPAPEQAPAPPAPEQAAPPSAAAPTPPTPPTPPAPPAPPTPPAPPHP